MTKIKKNNNNQITRSVAVLTIVSIATSFIFVLTAVAAGIAPTDVITLANTTRAKAHLSPLTENTQLSMAAKNKANDMIQHDYFAHTSPTGVDPWYWVKQSGYQYQAAGENLAINYTSAGEQHSAWMKSATHRANILNTRYQEIGVAVISGEINGKEALVTVEFFGTPLVVVADTVAPVPPIVSEKISSAIQGVESLVTMLPSGPGPEPQFAQTTKTVLPMNGTNWGEILKWFDRIWFVMAALLGLSLAFPAFLMLYRMYQHIRLSMKAQENPILSLTRDEIQGHRTELSLHA